MGRERYNDGVIVKLIIVEVISELREQFSLGQRAWGALSDLHGFRGQIGGWSDRDANRAVIIGLWEDQRSYGRFMLDTHDSVFETNGQKGTFASIETSLWFSDFDMPGRVEAFPDAIRQASLIRIARCRVRPDRTDHFVRTQREIWNPGMAGAEGMLAGAFSSSPDGDGNYLVCTLWRSESDHRAYLDGPFPELRRRAEVERDCVDLTGIVTLVEQSWKVVSPSK